ncbi:MAG: divalent metal cation transporter [Candidatus Aenigmatarchaeota archaeon]
MSEHTNKLPTVKESFPTQSKKKRPFWKALGPGLITGAADDDAGGVVTYSSIGAATQFRLLWLMLLSTPMLIAIQAMCAKVGYATKKGLGAVIREKYGPTVALVAIAALFIANTATTAANLAGMSVALQLITSVHAIFFVIPFGLLIWFVVVKFDYKKLEKVLLVLCLGFLAYIVTAVIANPPWWDIIVNTFMPTIELKISFLFLAVGLLGTTITPYLHYYQSGSEAEKGRGGDRESYDETKKDVYVGMLYSNLISYFIIVVAGTILFTNGITNITSIDQVAFAISSPDALGPWALYLFAAGLFAAAMLAAFVLPISTAYAVTETFGLETGVSKRIKEAPIFNLIFTITLIMGAMIVLLGANPIFVMIVSQVICGVVDPIIIFLLLRISNDDHYMGDKVNGRMLNFWGWLTFIVMSLFVVLMFLSLTGVFG